MSDCIRGGRGSMADRGGSAANGDGTNAPVAAARDFPPIHWETLC